MRTGIYITAILLFLSVTSIAQSKKSLNDAIRKAKDSIEVVMKARPIPGIAVTVSVNGKIVWSQGIGFADIEQKIKVDPSRTKFRIGSISKAITAAALARLYEQKMVILDSSIYFYLPDFPKKKYRPSIKQLAGHLAGVRHYKGNEWYNTKHFDSVNEGLTMFQDDSLMHPPGTKYLYSSHGFNLLSAVMESISNTEFLTLIHREVFAPLNLTNTMPDLTRELISYRSRYYDVDKGEWVNSPYVDNSYKWAGGGFLSTAKDVTKFALALLRDDYLKQETIQLFTSPQQLTSGTATTYGIGFATAKDEQGFSYFGHSGGSVGGTCDMVIYPNEKITVVVLTNLSDARLNGVARKIARLFIP